MTPISSIHVSNSRNAHNLPPGLVCVLMGATSGIGAGTLSALAELLDRPTFYVIGRSATRFREVQEPGLRAQNPQMVVHFIECQTSLIAGVDEACARIREKERRVDLLCMSAGLIPASGRNLTIEGLDVCMALSYYSRIRLVTGLLPLLRESKFARVLSVLNGGNEARFQDEGDLGVVGEYSVSKVVGNTTTMTTLAFELLAKQNPAVRFVHSYPGWVRTDIFSHVAPAGGAGHLKEGLFLLIRFVLRIVMMIAAMSAEECGERQTSYLLSDEYPAGVSRIGFRGDRVTEEDVLQDYRDRGVTGQIWDHTQRVFESALSNEV